MLLSFLIGGLGSQYSFFEEYHIFLSGGPAGGMADT